jgi:APA family basic amino acid/polyamine antiporter
MAGNLLRKKTIERLVRETEIEGHRLRRTLTSLDLVAIGIGCIIGVGIFVLPGVEAATAAGPGIILSFAIAAIACACNALCYAELAAMIPVSGSAYTYGYATLGEFFAWVIGWDLILQYTGGAVMVATGWSAYFVNLARTMGLRMPQALIASPWDKNPGLFNVPATVIVLVITGLLIIGIKESARVNLAIVIVKIGVILLFIGAAAGHIDPRRWQPFMPFGFQGVLKASAVVFLAYLGFDAVSTASEEARRPQRDIPIGIIGSLGVATILYIAVSAIMTGVVPYSELGVADPVAKVVNTLQIPWASAIISVGALAGMTTVLLVLVLSGPRILLSMSRDHLLPPALSLVHVKYRTPYVATLLTGVVVAAAAGLMPLNVSAELTSMGALFAFIFVAVSVIVLRRLQPEISRPFRVPLSPLVPGFGALICLYLVFSLSRMTHLRFFIWLVAGIIVYSIYGFRKSSMAAR